ncbi:MULTISPECIES: DUF2834 domain-containing protein [Microbacterium]|uniref:DUF2834 domain-containing protein n=1 Tax=Microbacterium wangchenii TaxID=2541726 RepID=A0ABX5SU86_9MICO|nr:MULTISPECIES: DUF2834 domain-containing protein [Microbacterium]MCK6067317.1 DUF2834 domain-containing protein [Microbacterium sp. EYE_512]QBR89741.1 DUF2834 domain-containing protein [Microbacterium wangchenii]TXK16661.1 DUF2834 domain-containing protein [Microbacterium wangchenii]
MTASRWTPLAIAYLALAVVGFVATFALNAWSVVQMRDYLGDLVGSGPAVASIGTDLLVVAVAGCIFIVVEARRLGMRRAWLYIVLSAVTAFAFTFPLFLAMRERRLHQGALDVSSPFKTQETRRPGTRGGPSGDGFS